MQAFCFHNLLGEIFSGMGGFHCFLLLLARLVLLEQHAISDLGVKDLCFHTLLHNISCALLVPLFVLVSPSSSVFLKDFPNHEIANLSALQIFGLLPFHLHVVYTPPLT